MKNFNLCTNNGNVGVCFMSLLLQKGVIVLTLAGELWKEDLASTITSLDVYRNIYHHFILHVFSLLEISCRRRRLLTASCTRDDQQQTSHAEGNLLAALNVKYLLSKATVHPNDAAAAFLDCRACFLCSPRASPAWDSLQQAKPSPGSSAEDIPVHLARGCSCMLMLSIGWSGRSLRIGVG